MTEQPDEAYLKRCVEEYGEEQSERNMKRLMVGGLAVGLAGLVVGTVRDSGTLQGVGAGILVMDALVYAGYYVLSKNE